MSKFLVTARYTAEGAKGLLKEGGSSRKKMVEDMVSKMGGRVECFYFCFGASDVVSVVEMPDTATAVALSLAINSTGAVVLSLTPLLSATEIDAASKKTVDYRAPGG